MMLAILIFWQTEGLSKFPEWIHRKNTQIMLLFQTTSSLLLAIFPLALLCLIIYIAIQLLIISGGS